MKNRKILSGVVVVAMLMFSQAIQAMVAGSSSLIEQATNDKDSMKYKLYQEALEAATTGNFAQVCKHFNGDFASFELVDGQKSNFYWAMVFIAAVNGDKKPIVAHLKGLPRFENVQEIIPYLEEDPDRDNAVRLGSL